LANGIGLANLLRWQWLAYWRRVLRGGTAAKTNLLVMGVLGAAGFARYLTFLRDVAKQTATGSTWVLELTLAAILLILVQPWWNEERLALGTRDMARYPLTATSRFWFRVLSRFISPFSWVLVLFVWVSVWPLFALPRPILAMLTYCWLATAAFAGGLALSDLSKTAKGTWPARLVWLVLAAAAGVWWWVQRALPSYLIVASGRGQWLTVIVSALAASAAFYGAWRTLPWMLGQAPPAERSRQARSARTLTLFRRELRLLMRLVEVRTAWFIYGALIVYMATASHPEPDALRVMLGVLAYLSIAVAMNCFGLDGAGGLDRFLLFPLRRGQVIAAKNTAFAMALTGPALPLVMIAAWRFGWREGTADLLEAIALCLAMLAWGNITSVLRPEGSGSGGGNVIDQLIATVVIGLVTAGAIGILRSTGNAAPVYVFALAAVFAALYSGSLWWSAGYFAREYEQIRKALN